ncbi:alpha/beta hydrolase [Nocardia halotolerans]|uniref:Alpha/beta hydrolase n=1 Tax=Nocardia halotolerans TaxID=1755878 RepID=A0ABV8VLB3_9NOCA
MTITELDFAMANSSAAGPRVSELVADVDGFPISARLAEAPRPRAVILALHGGATTSAYFDCPGHPRLSLLRTAPRFGFTVLALDRPGYGASHHRASELTDPDRIVDLIHQALDAHMAGLERGAGVFLMAHSAGSPHAVRFAADERGAALLGLELAGTGREHHATAAAVLGTHERADADAVRELLWQPSWLYPPEMLGGNPIAAKTPRYEGAVLRRWPDRDFPDLAARVRIPVHFSAGEYENVWRNDTESLAEVAALFTAAPRVLAEQLPAGGHGLSIGHSAAAYHLRVLAFAEECVIARTHAQSRSLAKQSDGRAPVRHRR